MSSDIKQDILDSLDDIGDLLDSYESLFIRVNQREPDNIELAALATVLQSFYNGVESIFLLVSKQIDNATPGDPSWHQVLLNQMIAATNKRAYLIHPDTASMLAPYLKFRHFFRHAYVFMLDWRQMKPLIDNLGAVWNTVRDDIMVFSSSL